MLPRLRRKDVSLPRGLSVPTSSTRGSCSLEVPPLKLIPGRRAVVCGDSGSDETASGWSGSSRYRSNSQVIRGRAIARGGLYDRLSNAAVFREWQGCQSALCMTSRFIAGDLWRSNYGSVSGNLAEDYPHQQSIVFSAWIASFRRTHRAHVVCSFGPHRSFTELLCGGARCKRSLGGGT